MGAKGVAGATRDSVMYLAFFLVGAGCGWFPSDAINNLILNEAALRTHWFGVMSVVLSTVGFCSSALYVAYLVFLPDGVSPRLGRAFVTALIGLSLFTLVLMASFWDLGAPHFPVVVLGTVLSTIVPYGTYLFVFPLVAVDYGGWLVAPLRTGTDISTFVTSLLGEVQNPTGEHNQFSSSLLFLLFAAFVTTGLIAWLVIVRMGLGLRALEEVDAAPEQECHEEPHTRSNPAAEEMVGAVGGNIMQRCRRLLRGFSCPRSLVAPILVGTMADMVQWGMITIVAEIGAMMTDPEGCSGTVGAWVARTSFTANRLLVPLGSFVSTPMPCPRCVMALLGGLHTLIAAALLSAALGMFRGAWATVAGQWTYIACFATLGGLEGYLFTMAYRKIGDCTSIPASSRRTASNLLSFLNVIVVCVAAMVMGSLVSSGTIHCTDP